MGRRLVLALLALGAVFAVHGVQCLGVGETLGQHAITLTAGSSAAHDLADQHGAPGQAAGDHGGTSGHAPAATLPGGSHDSAGHLWDVCLAVLVAGLALGLGGVLARLARRAIERRAPTPGRRPGRPDHRWTRLLHPPDLSQLCRLRI